MRDGCIHRLVDIRKQTFIAIYILCTLYALNHNLNINIHLFYSRSALSHLMYCQNAKTDISDKKMYMYCNIMGELIL